MTKTERIRYEMFLRVRDFGATHRDVFPESSTGGQAFAGLAPVISRLEEHHMAKELASRDGRQVKVAARAAITRRLRAIARTARRFTAKASGVENKLRMPRHVSDSIVLAAARKFVKEAAPIEDRLIALGLPANFIEQLVSEADAFELAIQGRRLGRHGVAIGQAGIKATIAEAYDLVRTLDTVVLNTLEGNPVLLAGWKRDRGLVDGLPHAADNPDKRAPEPAPPPDGTTTGDVLPKAS